MRSFLTFLALIVACLVAGALLAYPVYTFAHQLGADWPFHRVASRLAMLFLLVGFVLLLRRYGLTMRASLGYGLPRRQFVAVVFRAWILGALSMLPIVALLLALGIRAPASSVAPAQFLGIVLQGAISGFVVAFIEETFLRGALHTAIERESGTRAAVALTALLYGALHFLNRTRIPHEEVDTGSGLDLLAGTFSAWSHPVALLDSLLALIAVGVLLGLVRARTGHIAGCIGLHAGWVWVIAITRELTVREDASAAGWLVGSYDGVVGWLVLAWTLVLLAAARPLTPRLERLFGAHAAPGNS